MLGLLVIEWSRLFRLRPAPGQHGAVMTVGSFDFLESALLADIYGSALAATAARYRLRSITDLRFRGFIPLDAGGPLTLQTLAGGDIGVALLVTSDPNISAQHLVVLTDNRGLQSTDNVTPVVHQDVVARYGPALLALFDATARLATSMLRAIDAQVEPDGRNPCRVAGRWLRTHGHISEGGVVR